MTDLLTHLRVQLSQLPTSHISVALSGGLDSVVLLHVLCRLRDEAVLHIHAIHVHHGLSSNADDWLRFCQHLCQQWQVPLSAEKVQLSRARNIEAAARAARYEVLARQTTGVVALAHHADDQIETLLLALLRGGGLRALSAMTEWSEWQTNFRQPEDVPSNKHTLSGSLKCWRPLLPFSRQQLVAYATEHELSWVEDESNHDTRYLRNFVRQEWLPQLQRRLPQAKQQLLASVTALQQDFMLFNEWAAQDKAQVYQQGQWRVAHWRQLSVARGQQLLLQLSRDEHLGTPTHTSVANFAQVLRQAQQGEWRLPKGKVFFFRDKLLAVTDAERESWFWLPNAYSGSLQQIMQRLGQDLTMFRLPEQVLATPCCLRAASKHDGLLMSNGQHQSVHKLLAQHGIAAPLRHSFPLLCDEKNQVLAVLSVRVSAAWSWGNWLPRWIRAEKWLDKPHSSNMA